MRAYEIGAKFGRERRKRLGHATDFGDRKIAAEEEPRANTYRPIGHWTVLAAAGRRPECQDPGCR